MNDIIYVATHKYVYFDDLGKIFSITTDDNLEGNKIRVELDEVVNLMNGKEQFHHYVVIFDNNKKSYVLKHIFNEDDYNVNVNDQIHKISKNKVKNPDLTVTQDIKNKKWKFYLDNNIKTNIISNSLAFNKSIPFSITKANDPHQLEKYVTLNLNDLVKNDFVEIPFETEIELDSNALSVYTTKRLESYYHEVIE